MTNRKVSVRLAADGGQLVKNQMRELGREGKAALDMIAAGGVPASAGLQDVSTATTLLLARLDALSAKAQKAANGLREAGVGANSLLQRVNQATGVSTTFQRSAADIEAYGQAMDSLRAKHSPIFAVIKQYRSTLEEVRHAHRVGAISADEMREAISRERQEALASIAAIKGRTAALGHMADTSKFARFQMLNLGYQLQDIGVSLASGMSPWMVLAQQGSQIVQIYAGQGGVKEALRQTGLMARVAVTRFWPIALAVGATTAALAGLKHEINKTAKTTVTFGDVAKASWQLAAEGIGRALAPAVRAIAPLFAGAWEIIKDGVHQVGNVIINTFRAAVETVKMVFTTLPSIVGGAVIGAANAVIKGVEQMINAALGLINDMIDSVNAALAKIPTIGNAKPIQIGRVGTVGIPALPNPLAGAGEKGWQDYQDRIRDIMDDDPMGSAYNAISKRAQEIARARKAAEDEGGGSRGRTKKAVEEEKKGWDALMDSLNKYVETTRDIGRAVGDSIVAAFNSAEEAIGRFVETGKLDIRELAASIIADMAKIAARRYILGPLADALSGALSGAGTWLKGVMAPKATFDGGGWTGYGPRMGGLDGKGGFLAVLHPRERIIDTTRGRGGGGPVYVTINARDAESFRQSRAQVAADLQRAVAAGRRAS